MERMYTRLKQLGVSTVFHFTDSRNLRLISKHEALYSFRELKRRGIDHVFCGGNELSQKADRWAQVDNYVHLCFLRKHPLEYLACRDGRITETAWLEIDIEVLRQEGVRYTAGVSNKTGVRVMKSSEAIESLDFEAIYRFIDFNVLGNFDRKSNAEKYEILVPDQVPIKWIRNL